MKTSARPRHVHAADLRGLGRLAIDATVGITSLVEILHHNITRVPGPLGKSTQQPAKGGTGFVYRSIRGVTRLVGGGLDLALARLAPLLGEERSTPSREAVIAALNGVLGDHLERSRNPLAIAMRLRLRGKALEVTKAGLAEAFPGTGGRILLLVYGLCMSDLQWNRNGRDHGAAPKRGGNWVDILLDGSPYTTAFARLGKIRSARITDLRHGNLVDEDWGGRDRFAPSTRAAVKRHFVPLPAGVQCFAIAATLTRKRGQVADRLVGDGLVPVRSALGLGEAAAAGIAIPARQQWIAYGRNHLDLLDDRAVFLRLRKWLAPGGRQIDAVRDGHDNPASRKHARGGRT